MKRIVSKNHISTTAKVTAELDRQIEDNDCIKRVRGDLHKSNIHGRAAIAKSLINEYKAKNRKRWCNDDRTWTWTSDEWNYVTWSEESSFTMFRTSGRFYVWRAPKEAYNPEGLVPTVKHGGGSVMNWAISW
jgi:hypothetical protein